MNNYNSNDSNDSNDSLLINEYFNEPEPKRLSERRNAVKPYIPEPSKKNIEFIEVKEQDKSIFSILFCCYNK